jgi:peptidoglycan/xylan/chitin deacetylase (PgdA/CDA1 family)
MDILRLPLLWSYYQVTRPYRCVRNHLDARAGRAPILILFYHRIADDRATPWTCPNRTFQRQMRWLKSRFEMVSLAEAQQRIRSGVNKHVCASITFDDGYEDNTKHALPFLIREQIPCTYFVSTKYIFRREPFPHDVALGHEKLLPNSLTQLRELASAGVEIGAHTRTHADLGKIIDLQVLKDEVVTAGEELQAAMRRPVRYFAFPFGLYQNLNAEAFHLAYEAGYDGVCSAYGAINRPGDDAFHLQRFHGDTDPVRLKNWATIDPRKNNIPRYQYESALTDGTSKGHEEGAAARSAAHRGGGLSPPGACAGSDV